MYKLLFYYRKTYWESYFTLQSNFIRVALNNNVLSPFSSFELGNYNWTDYRMGLKFTWNPIVNCMFQSHFVFNSSIICLVLFG